MVWLFHIQIQQYIKNNLRQEGSALYGKPGVARAFALVRHLQLMNLTGERISPELKDILGRNNLRTWSLRLRQALDSSDLADVHVVCEPRDRIGCEINFYRLVGDCALKDMERVHVASFHISFALESSAQKKNDLPIFQYVTGDLAPTA